MSSMSSKSSENNLNPTPPAGEFANGYAMADAAAQMGVEVPPVGPQQYTAETWNQVRSPVVDDQYADVTPQMLAHVRDKRESVDDLIEDDRSRRIDEQQLTTGGRQLERRVQRALRWVAVGPDQKMAADGHEDAGRDPPLRQVAVVVGQMEPAERLREASRVMELDPSVSVDGGDRVRARGGIADGRRQHRIRRVRPERLR